MTELKPFVDWPGDVIAHTVVEFDVPDSYFGSEAPRWLRDWATMIISSPLKDTCDLRKRLIFACSFQPILLLVIAVSLAMIGIVATCWFILILGLRDIRLKHLFFIDGNPEYAWRSAKSTRPTISRTGETYQAYRRSSFYRENSKGEKHPPMVWVFHPVSLLVIAGVAMIWNFGDYTDLQRVLLLVMYVFLVVLGLWLLPKIVTGIFGPAIGYLLARPFEQIQSSRQEKRAMAKQRQFQDKLDMLSCQTDSSKVDLPKQTFVLWYQETKARYCKRFTLS